jgi:NADPH:quinone reductase-like Zn-dependent oxidoreductase
MTYRAGLPGQRRGNARAAPAGHPPPGQRADGHHQSAQLAATGGTVCVTGMLSGAWAMPEFEPVAMIPSGTKLTAFHSDDLTGAVGAKALQDLADGVADGRYHANLDRVFTLDDIVAAHHYMETNQATGKVVVRP